MKFTPKSDSEIEQAEKERKERWVWPTTSEYDFEVLGALEKEGDYGPYIDVEVKVFHPNGEWRQTLRDFAGCENPKLKALCYSVGLGARYESGELDAYELSGKSGKCKLGVKKDKNGQYPDKNKIADYVKSATQASQESKAKTKKAQESVPELDDEIPF